MRPDNSKFNQYFIYSLIGHALVLLAFRVDFFQADMEPMEIKNAIRVDIVGLPDKVEPKKAAAPAPKAPEKVVLKNKTKKTSKKELRKLKRKQEDAFTKLKQAQAMKALKEKLAQKREQEELKKEEEKLEYKGNVLTEGTQLSGLNQIALKNYYEDVKIHIQEHWTLPQWLSELNLRAQAQVLVDERGVVISRGIYASSGNNTFDDFVVSTIDKASPLPTPPSRLSSALKAKGFILKFPD